MRIADTGCGIPGDVREKIFNPFFSTKEQGTGLGLSIVHKIIEAHGGSINIETGPGDGTEFIITIPGR